MTEETTIPVNDDDDDMAAVLQASANTIENVLVELLDTASVTRVYGEPVQNGPMTIIPTAEIVTGLGFGSGFGGGSGTDSDTGQPNGGSGGGGGGGGRTFARPVAVIIASPDGVRVEPVVDVTKLGLAFITAAGFMLAVLFGFLKPRHYLRRLKPDH